MCRFHFQLGALLVALTLTGCFEQTPTDPDPIDVLETASFASIDEACYGDCAERAAEIYDDCRARGLSKSRCGQLVYERWRRCNDGCDGPDGCEDACRDRGAVALRACVRRGQSPARCRERSRRLVDQCARRVCQERVDILPCARRCKTRAYKTLRRCLRRGGHPSYCGQRAGAEFDACTARTCQIPTCDDITCPEGHECVMEDGGPACVAEVEPQECDRVRCEEGTHCQMLDEGPTCVPNESPCDDVVCPDGHQCEVLDGVAACVPDHVPTCEERCDRDAAEVFQTCVDRGEDPESCRAQAEHHADRCLRECPRPPETCDDVECPDDHSCEVMDGQAVCVPDRLQRSCDQIVCAPRHHCHETDDGPVCARDHGCEDTVCPDGWQCEEIEGVAQCSEGPLTCLQRCHRAQEARHYVCLHHERRTPEDCSAEAEAQREQCMARCEGPNCDNVQCPDGEVCEMRDGRVSCVEEEVDVCGDTVCPPRHHCHATNNGPVCARDHGCEDTNCPEGWQCEEIEGVAQCSESPLTCPQRCHRAQEARQYVCVYHELRPPADCIAEAAEQREQCLVRCDGPSCDDVQCPDGEICVLDEGQVSCVDEHAPECDNVQCRDGEVCVVRDGQASCVEEEPRHCGNTLCPPRHHCHTTDNGPVCARDHGCEDTICPEGSSCSEILGIAQCYEEEPTCTQWCYRHREASYYDCVHHHRRSPAVCAEEADQGRAQCVENCE